MTTPMTSDLVESLRRKQDSLMGRLAALTRRRDAREVSPEESVGLEIMLTLELGRLQDRLRMLGEHSFDGCPECRPVRDVRARPVELDGSDLPGGNHAA